VSLVPTRSDAGPPRYSYLRRRPEESVLYQAVQEHWETFRSQTEEGLPAYVVREFESFLRCGFLAHGFLRMKCEACRHEKLVAFSCKRRGFCSSCAASRMSESAAFWVDHVFPHVPVRQWVLSVPIPLRFWMARNPGLLGSVLAITIRAIERTYARKARRAGIQGPIRTGSVTVVQRFGGSVNLNIHFHMLFLEGVYQLVGGKPEFLATSAPTHEDVEETLLRNQARLLRLLRKRGLVPRDGQDVAVGAEDGGAQSVLVACQEASVAGRIALGPRAGHRVRRMGSFGFPGEVPFSEGPRCVGLGGFSLHANVAVGSQQREQLEHLCRYIARPPVAEERLYRTSDGHIAYRVKREWSDGTQALLFSPMEFMEKLAALVPQPRIHLTRFHGVLAPHHAWRGQIVPRVKEAPTAQGAEMHGVRPVVGEISPEVL